MWGGLASTTGPLARNDELRNAFSNELHATTLAPTRVRAIELSTAGLADYATLGVLADHRRDRGAKLITTESSTPMSTLVWTVLPPLPPADLSTVEARLFARLPTFYSEVLLPAALATDPVMLRAMLERGLGKSVRALLRKNDPSTEAAKLVAHARLRLGLLYWRGVDFDRALAAIGPRRDDESLVLMAVAIALRSADDDRMRRLLENPSAPNPAHLRPLEWLSRSEGPLFAIAAYDLAIIADATGADGDDWRVTVGRYDWGAARLRGTPFASLAKRSNPRSIELNRARELEGIKLSPDIESEDD